MPPTIRPSHLRHLGVMTGDTRNSLQSLIGRQGLEGGSGPEGPEGKEGKEGKAGPWEKLTSILASISPAAGFETPEARTEGGASRAFLRGVYEVTVAVKPGEKLFAVPASCKPKAKILVNGATVESKLEVSAAGSVTAKSEIAIGALIVLDSVNWNLT